MIKVKCLVLVLALISSLFADNFFPKSKWQFYNEYAQKDNVFFYDSYDNSDNNKSKFPLYLKEFFYAFGGSCIGVFGLLLPITIPAGAAYGTRLAARKWDTRPEGKFWCSFLGAACGSAATIGLGWGISEIYKRYSNSEPRSNYDPDDLSGFGAAIIYVPLAAIVLFSANSIGAVIGYNLSIPKDSGFESGYGFLNRHFDLPSFTMKTEKTQEGKTITAFDFRLINARF